jgi:hypothetical protein
MINATSIKNAGTVVAVTEDWNTKSLGQCEIFFVTPAWASADHAKARDNSWAVASGYVKNASGNNVGCIPHTLRFTNFGFNLNAEATITSICVHLWRKAWSNSTTQHVIDRVGDPGTRRNGPNYPDDPYVHGWFSLLLPDDDSPFTAYPVDGRKNVGKIGIPGSLGTHWSVTAEEVFYGWDSENGYSELSYWGLSTWPETNLTVSTINDAGFGFIVSPEMWSTIYYSPDWLVEIGSMSIDSCHIEVRYTLPGYLHDVNGIPAANIKEINGIPSQNIKSFKGV